jgi:hypothetical protein
MAALGAAMEARLGQQALGLPVAAAAQAAVAAAVGRWRLH